MIILARLILGRAFRPRAFYKMEKNEIYERVYRRTILSVRFGVFDRVAADETNVDAAVAAYERATGDIIGALVKLLDDFKNGSIKPRDPMGRRQDAHGG